jgi:hypothetical protein
MAGEQGDEFRDGGVDVVAGALDEPVGIEQQGRARRECALVLGAVGGPKSWCRKMSCSVRRATWASGVRRSGGGCPALDQVSLHRGPLWTGSRRAWTSVPPGSMGRTEHAAPRAVTALAGL